MKKKGQRTFNNENVHRVKMLGLTLYPLYSPWLLDIFHQRGKVIDSSPASKTSAPSETKWGVWKSRNRKRSRKRKRNPNPNPNLRNKNWRRFCLESVTNYNCSIKTFHHHIIFIYCYYIFYCRIFAYGANFSSRISYTRERCNLGS